MPDVDSPRRCSPRPSRLSSWARPTTRVLGRQLAEVSEAAAAAEQPPPWKIGVELLRCLVLATVVAGLAAQGEIDEWTGGLLLGLALWIGFPLVLWTGALIHENTPMEAGRHPRRRLAREAARGGADRERLAVAVLGLEAQADRRPLDSAVVRRVDGNENDLLLDTAAVRQRPPDRGEGTRAKLGPEHTASPMLDHGLGSPHAESPASGARDRNRAADPNAARFFRALDADPDHPVATEALPNADIYQG